MRKLPTLSIDPLTSAILWLAAVGALLVCVGRSHGGELALIEVNAARAKRGLPAYIADPGLMVAAEKAAAYRAERLIEAHTPNDFSYVPKGSRATAAGCGARGPGGGFASCCMYENWKYAGAAWDTGRDGRRYMHLYVR